MRQSARSTLHSITATTTMMPTASASTGSVVSTRQPAQDSTTSPP